jgi:capsular exopolysaccharide synthesis family protein
MAQLGKRVLLIDGDMRRPSLATKLPIERSPGLSDFLTGQNGCDQILQTCCLKKEENAFHVISAGRTPPNPMELLGSTKMEKMITDLRNSYDYIIIDLPPVNEVGDALVTAKLTDGILLVVRQNYCDRIALNTTVRQFEFIDAKILGFVYNSVSHERESLRRKYSRYYSHAYKRYYNRVGGVYEAANKESKEAEE